MHGISATRDLTHKTKTCLRTARLTICVPLTHVHVCARNEVPVFGVTNTCPYAQRRSEANLCRNLARNAWYLILHLDMHERTRGNKTRNAKNVPRKIKTYLMKQENKWRKTTSLESARNSGSAGKVE